ncbi:MAG: GntR family transcriptional regulator [Candidatus Adiutrix sp.]|jgi:GntR family transcriptional regulator|nr:GntR family transcriptional regulator [Candidatus Adiutrix sp.]
MKSDPKNIGLSEQSPDAPLEIPAYLRLAEAVKMKILDGVYKAGGRIPSEAAICKSSGLALLTVRQALGVLVEEGLLERFPGRGTYVKELSWRGASFSIDGLVDRVGGEGSKVRIVRTEVRRASPDVAEKLELNPGDSVVYLKRTIATGGTVFLIQEGHLLLDPGRPIMEAELEATYLSGLFAGSGQGLIKTAKLSIAPVALSDDEARLLERRFGAVGFRLEYVFFDAAGKPLASGSFITPDDSLKLSATIGVRFTAHSANGAH